MKDANGTFECPLCGTCWPHEHTGEEIAIYNGARSLELELKALKAAIGAVEALANHYVDKGLDGRKEYPLYGVVLRTIKNRLEQSTPVRPEATIEFRLPTRDAVEEALQNTEYACGHIKHALGIMGEGERRTLFRSVLQAAALLTQSTSPAPPTEEPEAAFKRGVEAGFEAAWSNGSITPPKIRYRRPRLSAPVSEAPESEGK